MAARPNTHHICISHIIIYFLFVFCTVKKKKNVESAPALCRIMSDYHKLLLLSLFDVFGSRQRGTKRLLTACHTHRLDAEMEIPEKSRVTSKCQRRFFSGFDTELMKSAAEDFGSAVNEAVKGLLSNTMKSADTKAQHRQEKLRLLTFAAVHLVWGSCNSVRFYKRMCEQKVTSTSRDKTFMGAWWGHLGIGELCVPVHPGQFLLWL